MERFAFFRIAWMREYKGKTDKDIPIGAGSYVNEHADGGEVYNFLPARSRLYAFARIQKDRGLRIERLGANPKADFVDNITVVFFSTNPETGGQRVVGWFTKARVYRKAQKLAIKSRRKHPWYFVETSESNLFPIKPQDPIFDVPKDGPGQTNFWYVEEYHDKEYLKRFMAYMRSPKKGRNTLKKRRGKWLVDWRMRQKVELTAMSEVAKYFETLDFDVSYVHQQKRGWDLEAVARDGTTLLLEVKGLSGSFEFIDLTPNEYNCCNSSSNYRICVVSNALNNRQRALEVYYRQKDKWRNNEGKQLKIKVIKSARFLSI